jgi:hypothetical protein
MSVATKTPTATLYNLPLPSDYGQESRGTTFDILERNGCGLGCGQSSTRCWGKSQATSRPDTATRMAMDADFGGGRESTSSGPRPSRERDDLHLVKPAGPLADVNFQELIRIVNEAQERDAEDERRLYNPMLGDRS